MSTSSYHVAVVGAGFVGAMLCHHLSERGARVSLFEALAGPARGVTGASMGWINSIMCDPVGEADAYGQRLEALRLFNDLNVRLGRRQFADPVGSLVWHRDSEITRTRFAQHEKAGGAVELIGRKAFENLAPRVTEPPEWALFSAADLALDPVQATKTLLQSAKELGASVTYGAPATCRVADRGTAHLDIAGEHLAFDAVVAAAGPMSADLLGEEAPQDLAPPSPMAMVVLEAKVPGQFPILCGPDIEVRRLAGNRFLSVCAPPEDPPDGLEADALRALGEERAKRVAAIFGNHVDVRVVDVKIGNRPMTHSGLPFVGKAPGCANLYTVSGHPGIICAPGLARDLGQLLLG